MLPSENEALGVVLMEGMAAGTPIIARDGEGGAELINQYGTGFLYRPEEGVGPFKRAGGVLEARRRTLQKPCRGMQEDRAGRISPCPAFGTNLETLYREVLAR